MPEQYFYRINGMSSHECVNKIQDALKNLAGIEMYEVDLETGMASVKASVPAQEITSAILAAGYNAVLISDT